MRRHHDRLHHELPDRNDRAQNEESVNYCFEQASILVFRLRLHDEIVSCRFMGVHRLPCSNALRVPAIFIGLYATEAVSIKMRSLRLSRSILFLAWEMA